MADFKNYRDATKANWGTSDDKLTLEQVNTGCLLRIADAIEKMASNYQRMENELAMYKRRHNEEKEYKERHWRTIRAMKGVITKLKNSSAKTK